MTAAGVQVRQQRASDPQRSVWVAASAGSGKTKVLTDRVLRLLLAGARSDRILCLTFTRAAAAEMATRIAARLSQWAVADDGEIAADLARLSGRPPEQFEIARARRLFATVLDTPGGVKVETIHAFCQSVLRRFPIEAGLPSGFMVMDERTQTDRLRSARDRMLIEARENGEPDLAEALAILTETVSEDPFNKRVNEVLHERGKLRQAMVATGGLDALCDRLRQRHGIEAGDTAESIIQALAEGSGSELRPVAVVLTGARSKPDRERGQAILDWLDCPQADRPDAFEGYWPAFLTQAHDVRKTLATKPTLKACPEAKAVLETEAARIVATVMRLNALDIVLRTSALLRIGHRVVEIYEQGKRRRGLLDFDDLILSVRDLLGRPDVASWVLFKLDGGLDHILIDEAQDTNPAQWEIVRSLAEEFFAGLGAAEERGRAARTVFAVGDTKQSIFSFQRADPEGFSASRDLFSRRVNDAGMSWEDVHLDTSFRSTAAVLAAVDAVFNRPGAADGVVGADHLQHLCHRIGQGGRVELWPLEIPRPDAGAGAWEHLPVEQMPTVDQEAAVADSIANQVREWLDRGEILESHGRPVRPDDILILLRRRGTIAGKLVRSFRQRNIEVAGVDRMVLTDQLAVMDLVALGQFLILPDDDLNLATVLKGPFINLSEALLFDLCHQRKNRRVWYELVDRKAECPAFRDAHDWLADLLGKADFRPPYELFADMLVDGGRAALLRRLGPEAGDPIDEFLVQAQAYERVHPPSLQGFLHWLAASDFEVKRDLETGAASQVRIMTVHGSKGLQAPIVFVPDTTSTPTPSSDVLWVDEVDGVALPLFCPGGARARDRVARAAQAQAETAALQEYRRLLYVAMTRAEDRLYVTGWGKRTKVRIDEGCWYQLVEDGLNGIATEIDERRVLVSEQQVLPVPDRQDGAAAGRDAALPDWARKPALPDSHPPRPLRPSAVGTDPPVRAPFEPGGNRRFRRGLIIHHLLQWIPQLPVHRRLDAVRRYLARPVHALPAEDQADFAREVMALIEDPRFADLFSPSAVAEAPIVGMVGEGAGAAVVSGRIDRLHVGEYVVTAVDFKTSRPPPDHAEQVAPVYLRQMALYRDLLRSLYPDRTIRCALLWTDGPTLMTLPDELLDRSSVTGPADPRP